jgi:hypothetical protein
MTERTSGGESLDGRLRVRRVGKMVESVRCSRRTTVSDRRIPPDPHIDVPHFGDSIGYLLNPHISGFRAYPAGRNLGQRPASRYLSELKIRRTVDTLALQVLADDAEGICEFTVKFVTL